MTNPQSPWVLPAGIDEVLPDEAKHLEHLRQQALRLFDRWGYDLVLPPMVEFLETLLVGTGADLELDTLKVTDGLSGRLLGVRADMTPQIARMDARSLPECSERRLCYVGTVIRGSGDALGGSRAPIQLGGELFGADNTTCDHEVLDLLAELLTELGVPGGVFDLGHVGIFRSLAEAAGMTAAQIERLRDATARKAVPEIQSMLAEWSVADDYAHALVSLCQLSGPVAQVAEQADSRIAPLLDQSGREALQRLTEVAQLLQRHHGAHHQILVDLAEVHGYHYHTGLVFAVYLPRLGRALARGGRYNNIGDAFGRARPAIGFSLDLRDLAAFAPREVCEQVPVYAPADLGDPELREAVLALRRSGRRVISTMDNIQNKPARLERSGNNQQTWQLVEDKNDG